MKYFNWKDYGDVTPVRDQKECGDCWAFGAVAAYESSYLIENGLKVTATNAAASEQQALDCSFVTYDCKGGWHDKVFDFFVNNGETTKLSYPYTAIKAARCKESEAKQYTAIQWDYVQGADIPSDDALKAAICTHGPVVAAVNAALWDKFLPSGQFAYSTNNPNWDTDYPLGVLHGIPSKRALQTPGHLANGDIDHDILIVGWDDAAKAWIIKNSWNTYWGDQGFGKIAYGTANIGYNAAWIQASRVHQGAISSSIMRALASVNVGFKKQFRPDFKVK